MKSVFLALVILAYLSLLWAIISGGIRYSNLNRSLKWFFYYFFGIGLIELSSEIFNLLDYKNLWLLHYQVVHEFVFLSLTYKLVFNSLNPKSVKIWNYSIGLGAVLLIGARLCSIRFPEQASNWILASNGFVHSSIIVLSCLYLYYHILGKFKSNDGLFFIINASILCFFASTFISDLIFSEVLIQTKDIATKLWIVQILISIAFYITGGFVFHKLKNVK